jgi:hypothetical protein
LGIIGDKLTLNFESSVMASKTSKSPKSGLKSPVKKVLDKPKVSAAALPTKTITTKSKPSKPSSSASKKATKASSPSVAVKKTGLSERVDVAVKAGESVASQAPTIAEKSLKENLSKEAVGSPKSRLRVFQIYYEDWHRELLDPNFIPLNNGKSQSELLEFNVFDRLSKSDYVKGAQLWGALSWRFTEKTGLTGSDLVKSINAHPGFDVYYCDPFPHNQALFHNLWLQGETTHPNFLALSQAVLQAAELSTEELINVCPSNMYSAANYFIATPKFWTIYIPWVNKVLTAANKKLPPKLRDLLHSSKADSKDLHGGASYLPFIIERLFPIFMKTEGKNLKGYQIALPERERDLNVHLKLLREMKDVAWRTKSAWMIACWVNYRNLYLTQTNKKEWCKKYLRAVTPITIKFY